VIFLPILLTIIGVLLCSLPIICLLNIVIGERVGGFAGLIFTAPLFPVGYFIIKITWAVNDKLDTLVP